MRKFIVLQQIGDISRIRVVDYGTELKRPLVYWEISDDSRRMLVSTKLSAAFKKYFAGGSYESDYGALIGLSFDKAYDTIVSVLGPDVERSKQVDNELRSARIAHRLGLSAGFLWVMSLFLLKIMTQIIVIPLKIILFTLLLLHITK